MRWVALAIAIVLIAGCAPRPVRTVTLDGERWEVLVGTSDGMRDLPDFAGKDAMIFIYDEEVDHRAARWVMDRVVMPLDIAWFDGGGVMVGRTTMPICSDVPCPLYQAPAPYRWVLEAPVGAFDHLPDDARLVVP